MSGKNVDCWNCGAALSSKSGRQAAPCPDCGEYLADKPDGHDLFNDSLTQSVEGTDSVFNIHANRAARRRGHNHDRTNLVVGVVISALLVTTLILVVGVSFYIYNNQESLLAKFKTATRPRMTSKTTIPPFNPVDQEALKKVHEKQLQEMVKRLAENNAKLTSEILDKSTAFSNSIEIDSRHFESTMPPFPAAHNPTGQISANPAPSQIPQQSIIEQIARKKNDESSVPARFTFSDGDEYRFQYEVAAEFDNRTEVTSGQCTYNVLGRDKQQSVVAKSREGSGTAFVVLSDGVLVTCAHVIEDADEIEVHIGKKIYLAEIVESDVTTDLAILKIEAEDLTTLPLGDSDAALLGQDVRAVGFPLSDVLGTDVKVTRGTISGIMQRDGQKQLQIDAAVNPGNSGGPVVNSRGEVVGVASAKLSGMEIHRVGFSVPANEVRVLLKKNGLTSEQGDSKKKELKGPDLVTAVTPAVAFVKVKSGPDEDAKHSELRFTGNFHKSIKDARGLSVPSFRLRGSNFGIGRGTLLVTHTGEIVRASEEAQLPFLVGPPSQLPLFEFRKGKRNKWTLKRETTLIHEKPETTASGVELPRYIDPFGRRRNSEVVKVLPAIEIATYTIKSEDNETVVIGLNYDFHTTVSENGQTIKLVGEGEYQFDKLRGCTSSYEFKGTYLVESEQVTLKVPLTVTATLLSRKEIEAEAARAAVARAEEAARPSAVNSMGTAPKLNNLVKQQITEMGWGIKSLAFSPDGKFVAAGKADDFVELYSVETGLKIFTEGRLREMGNISAITFSPDGKYLLAGGFKGLIKIWQVAENGLLTLAGEFTGHSREVSQIAVSPDGKHVLSSGAGKQIRCWNLQNQKEEFVSALFDYGKFGIYFLAENQAFVSDGRVLQKLDLTSGKVEQTLELRSSGSANNVFFSPDGQRVAVTDGYSLRHWSTETGNEFPELRGKETLWDADFSADGKKIIAGGRGHLVVWDLDTQERDGHILLGDSIMYVKPLDVSEDGKYVACYPSAAGQSLWIFELQEPDEVEASPSKAE